MGRRGRNQLHDACVAKQGGVVAAAHLLGGAARQAVLHSGPPPTPDELAAWEGRLEDARQRLHGALHDLDLVIREIQAYARRKP